MDWLIALVAGAVLPIQAGINATLARGLGHPMFAAAASFLTGSMVLVLVLAALRLDLPGSASLRALPWWTWSGGALGVAYVVAVIVTAPRLGAAAVIALAVAGQMAASLVIDHYGLVGFPVRPLDLSRILGALMVAGGVLLIKL